MTDRMPLLGQLIIRPQPVFSDMKHRRRSTASQALHTRGRQHSLRLASLGHGLFRHPWGELCGKVYEFDQWKTW